MSTTLKIGENVACCVVRGAWCVVRGVWCARCVGDCGRPGVTRRPARIRRFAPIPPLLDVGSAKGYDAQTACVSTPGY